MGNGTWIPPLVVFIITALAFGSGGYYSGWYKRDYDYYRYDAPKFATCVPAMTILEDE